jgi:hypothetical protein
VLYVALHLFLCVWPFWARVRCATGHGCGMDLAAGVIILIVFDSKLSGCMHGWVTCLDYQWRYVC